MNCSPCRRCRPPTTSPPQAACAASASAPAGRSTRPLPDQAVPLIQLSIRHGNLAYARHPVLVGHYLGDTIVSAEKALDERLDNALSSRLQLGLYPGRSGTHALFFHPQTEGKPGGAVVVGLGQVGELSPGLLWRQGYVMPCCDYALRIAQWPDKRFGPADSPRSAALTCLLVGSGAGGIEVRDSVEAILRAAAAANAKLVAAEMEGKVIIDRLEFLELYEDVAISTAEALESVLQRRPTGAAGGVDRACHRGRRGRLAAGALRRGAGLVATSGDHRGEERERNTAFHRHHRPCARRGNAGRRSVTPC